MAFFPQIPTQLNTITLFGITLLLGLIGGELAGRTRFIPRITGYIAAGILIGPEVLNIASKGVLLNAQIFVEISLSLILFDLGRHLDVTWLYHDRSLLRMSLLESTLTFCLIFTLLKWVVALAWLPAALGGIIAIATSPAVVMMVADDLSSEGPVTRRTLILTSLNNLIALVLFTLLLPLTHAGHISMLSYTYQSTYLFFGSILLASVLFLIAKLLARVTGKHKQNQFILFIGMLVITMGLASTLRLSYMVTLFMLGVLARNADKNHVLMEIDFKWLARLFIVLLFVVTGVQLELKGLWRDTWIIALFILIRTMAKSTGILCFFKTSRLTKRQTLALCFTLTPMAGVAIGMSNRLADFNPDVHSQLIVILAGAIAMLNIIGPIMTQLGFIVTGESHHNSTNG